MSNNIVSNDRIKKALARIEQSAKTTNAIAAASYSSEATALLCLEIVEQLQQLNKNLNQIQQVKEKERE